MSSRYSTWPVILCIYNLPPWLCMKRKYIMMSLLISGPKQLGNDIDVYLSPLFNDMKTLWKPGVEMYDAYMKEKFNMQAMSFCTINDFPAYSNLSRYNTKGKRAYPVCEDEISSRFGYSDDENDMSESENRLVLELHINFLEDQPNVIGTGPNWMFDLDFLTNSMNYIPVSVENQVNVDAGTQDSYVAGSLGKDKGPPQEYILLLLQPYRTRIPIEDVSLDAHEKPSESSPRENDV
ncbi:hypothetical protein Tco_0084029 [Tanacetum coccineum]